MMHAINLNPLCTAVRIPGLWAISKHILPGCDRSSKKLWVTQLLLQDAPLNCKTAMPAKWNKYFLENNIEMLLIDNVPGHPPFIGNLHPNIQVVFLPLKPSF